MTKEGEFCCVPVLYFISGVARSMLLGARFVISRPGSGNTTTFVPFNSILGFPAPARRTQPPVSRMSLTMRCLHKTLTFIHVLPLLLLHSGSQRAGVDSSSLGVKVVLLSGSQQFVTTPHRENKQPSALTLTCRACFDRPQSGKSPQRHKEAMRNP